MPLASTGMQAVEYCGGRTVHSFAKIPVSDDATVVSDVRYQSERAHVIRKLDVIFIDEVMILEKKVFEAVDELFRNVRGKSAIFGGVLVVAIGDCRQPPPVVKGGTRAMIVAASVTRSDLWKHAEVYVLNKSYRVQDAEFLAMTDDVGNGLWPSVAEGDRGDMIVLPPCFLRQKLGRRGPKHVSGRDKLECVLPSCDHLCIQSTVRSRERMCAGSI